MKPLKRLSLLYVLLALYSCTQPTLSKMRAFTRSGCLVRRYLWRQLADSSSTISTT
jgi:hypothetical protein